VGKRFSLAHLISKLHHSAHWERRIVSVKVRHHPIVMISLTLDESNGEWPIMWMPLHLRGSPPEQMGYPQRQRLKR